MEKKKLAAAMLVMVSLTAQGEVVAICGTSEGRSYYPPSALVQEHESGWVDDRVSKGSFQLVRSGDAYDIIYTDATGGTLSSKGDGGHIAASKDDSGNLAVTVFYPGVSIETWVFWFAAKGKKIVTYTQAKYSATIPKHSLLRAACKW